MLKNLVAAIAAVKLSSLAVLAGLWAVAGSVAFGDTLASWTLNSNAAETPIQAATSNDVALTTASLTAGIGVTKNGTNNSYGGSSWHEGTTLVSAVENNNYLEISFTVSPIYAVTPLQLDYKLRKPSTTSPTSFQWICIIGNAQYFTVGSPVTTFFENTGDQSYTLDLTSLGTLAEGAEVKLRIVAWGAAKTAGTFNFTGSISMTGTRVRTSSDLIPLSIMAIDDQACYAGDPLSVLVTLSGDEGENMVTNAVALTSGVTGSYSSTIEDGVFTYTPSVADAALNNGEIAFRITYSGDGLAAVTEDFTVQVSIKPDFLEDFEVEKNHSNFFNPTETFTGVAASWRGTNFNVNAISTVGYGLGGKTSKFRATGYMEMTTDKANGAGKISFWHRLANGNNKDASGSFTVEISNNEGATWRMVGEAVSVSAAGETSTLVANVGGAVRVRFTYTCNYEDVNKAAAVLDNIEISNYDGAATIDPAIGEIADLTIHADESCEIGIVFYGDEGLTKNVECITPGVDSGRYNLDSATGTFTYTPSLADLALNGGVISFNISLKEGEVIRASRSFTVTLLVPIAKWLELRAGSIIRENFDSIGGAAESALPAPWHVASTNALECFSALSYALTDGARDTTTQRAKLGAGTTTSGIYNLGAADNAEDRAVGFLSASSSANKFRTCALMVPLKNIGSSTVSQLSVQFTWEKWRTGRAKKLDVCYSTGAPDWVWTKIDGFHRGYDAEEGSTAFIAGEDSAAWAGSDNDIERQPTRGKVNVEIPANGILYLGWFYSASEENSANAQVWAIDDVRIVVGNTEATTVIMR